MITSNKIKCIMITMYIPYIFMYNYLNNLHKYMCILLYQNILQGLVFSHVEVFNIIL